MLGLDRLVRTSHGTLICQPSSGRGGTWHRCRRQLLANTATSIRFASAADSSEDSRWTRTRPYTCYPNGTRDAGLHGPLPSCSTSSGALLGTGASPSADCSSRSLTLLNLPSPAAVRFPPNPAFMRVRRRISPSLRMRSESPCVPPSFAGIHRIRANLATVVDHRSTASSQEDPCPSRRNR